MTKKRRNIDTTAANEKRSKNAEEFADYIADILSGYEEKIGQKLSVGLMARALNQADIKTRRGSEWSTTSVKRILDRAKRNEPNG